MKNELYRYFLLTLLFLYLLARILQLFAGRVPSLLVVIFHVIPRPFRCDTWDAHLPFTRYPWLVFATLCLGAKTIFESMSLRTDLTCGYYRFTNLMGPKLFDLPILLALAYVGMGYL
jgi:hypothetical protein